jgi:formate hydrogenlyase transcriptional activator
MLKGTCKMSAHPKLVTYGEEPRFERLLTDLSIPLVNSSANQISSKIEAAQKAISDTLGFDHSELAQWDEASKLFVITHSAISDDCLSGRKFTQQDIPWVSAKIFRGEVIHFTRQSRLSERASRDIETLFHTEIQSATFFPLKTGEQILGFLCFGTSRVEGEWLEQFDDRLHFIADMLAKALGHNHFDSPLIRSLAQEGLEADERFQLIIESFPAAVVMADDDGNIVLLNSRTVETFGYEREELLGQPIEMLIPQCFGECRGASRPEFVEHPGFKPMGTDQELYGVRKDGCEFQIEVAESPIRINGVLLNLSTITDITDRKLAEQALIDVNVRLLEANEQIRKMKEQSKHENIYLKQEIKLAGNHIEVVGQSQAILQVLMKAEQVAATDATVLLLGETGTGKELIARAIHRNSKRKTQRMVNVNCAALPASLVENELFGRERGAYTGALTREVGRFELADRSTIFLDEIGELPLELQAKLLRVLQEGEFERLGSSKTIHVDVRLIAATSRNLEAAVREGKFREDLYYRLNVFPIRVPPLRERREDIPMLTWHFLRELGGRMGRDVEAVRATTMKAFQGYSWPGNVRELRNVIERNLIIHPDQVFEAELPEGIYAAAAAGTTIEEVERNHISRELERSGWRIRGFGGAAETLGLKPTTLEARMKKLGIVRK